jgi:hypothetical protein
MRPQVASSPANAESCPSCGCHLDLLTDAGCPYCGWNDSPRPVGVVSGPTAGLFDTKSRSTSSVWGERLLMGVTFVVVAFAAFSLVVSLIQLLSGVFAG